MSGQYRVAVAGASSLAGEAIIDVLTGRDFPLAGILPLDAGEAVAARVEVAGSPVRIGDIDAFDFGQADIVFFAGAPELAQRHAEQAARAGCVVIDGTGCFSQEPDVPLVVAEVNPGALATFRDRRIVASPRSSTVLAAVVLKALASDMMLKRVHLVAIEAVSEAGQAGVRALAGETANLLNARPLGETRFPAQVAFNLVPQVGARLDGGHTTVEVQVTTELQRLFGAWLGVAVSVIQAPVFHGHALNLFVESEDPVAVDYVTGELEHAADIEVAMPGEAPDFSTPVAEADHGDRISVGRIRQDDSQPNGLTIWVVADNIRRGIAKNCVQIAEILVKDYF